MAGAGRDVIFEILPVVAGEISGSAFGPILPDIGSRGEGFAAPRGSHHCAAGHENDGNIDHDCSHEQGRDGFIASSHENRAIDGVTPEGFLDLHGEEVTVEHRGGLHEGLAETHHGHFDGVSTGLPDAAFDFLGTLAKMRVAGEEVVPGVEDGDDGFAFVFLLVDAELFVAGAMAEGTEIIGAEEAVRAELIGGEATHDVE